MDIMAFSSQLATQYGYLGIFIAALLGNASLFIPLPTLFIVYAAGAAFDPFLVGLAAGLGAAIGELSGYLVGYGIFRAASAKKPLQDSKRYRQAGALLRKYGAAAVFVFAATPLPFDIIGLVAGFERYALAEFFVAELAGKLLKMWAVAYAGMYSMGLVLTFFSNELVGYGILVIVAIAAGLLYWRYGKGLEQDGWGK